jgi:hypothetical protein
MGHPLVQLHAIGEKPIPLALLVPARLLQGSIQPSLCGNQPVSWVILENIAWTFVSLYAIEPTRSRGQHRVDGVGRPKFDFHTESSLGHQDISMVRRESKRQVLDLPMDIQRRQRE